MAIDIDKLVTKICNRRLLRSNRELEDLNRFGHDALQAIKKETAHILISRSVEEILSAYPTDEFLQITSKLIYGRSIYNMSISLMVMTEHEFRRVIKDEINEIIKLVNEDTVNNTIITKDTIKYIIDDVRNCDLASYEDDEICTIIMDLYSRLNNIK